jgi:hypothetical protein
MIQAWDKLWAVFRDVADFQIEHGPGVVRVCPHPFHQAFESVAPAEKRPAIQGCDTPLWNARRPGAAPQFTEVPSQVLMKCVGVDEVRRFG